MFIQTEATPNPQTLKFLPGRDVKKGGAVEFLDIESAEKNSPLAARLLKINGVERVFLGPDFISITKNDIDWQLIKPALLGAIMDHYMSGEPSFIEGEQHSSTHGSANNEEDLQIVDTIKELLDTRVRPAVAQDGGDITFQNYQDGIVYLHMQGACAGCPSSTITLKHGIENLLKHFIPEVVEVRPVEM